MNSLGNFQKEGHYTTSRNSWGIDPKTVLNLILKNWYYFVIAFGIAMFGARFFIRHTMPAFMTSTTILINQQDDRASVDNEQLLQGLGLPNGMSNLENQILVLKSRALTEKTIKELPFEIEYYYKTIRNKIPVYPDMPIKVIYEKSNPLPRDTEFSIKYVGNNMLIISSEDDNFKLNKTVSFGDEIEVPGGVFVIESRDTVWFEINKDRVLFFMISSPERLSRNLNGRLDVELVSRTGSILKLSLTGTNRNKDADFLNKLAEVFQTSSLDKKNNEAIRRIQFIDDQLIGISDSLSITESKLQQFRSSHRVMDLSAQGQAIIQQVTILENERARLNLEANYYDYLAEYLAKDVSGELPIIPITMGITDPGLTRLVTELADLQSQLTSRSTGEMNPLQNLLAQRVRSTKEALLETLNGLRRANSLARSENQEQINKVNSQASALPVTERQLLGIERKFRLNDEMYTFLLETRAEQQMQKASNTADSEVIDPADARYSIMVSPNRNMIFLIALFLAFGIPFIIVFLQNIFNRKISTDDIESMTEISTVGNIPHSMEKTNTVVFDSPGSSIAEAYRLMRSRMQFFTKDKASPVILVTSSMPMEGKTYTAINLASVYSLLGKKTVLVGFDLRKPKIIQDFDISNEKGVSTWLIGKDKLQDIIQPTSYDNLFIISAGPIPPNPSELIALEKTDELLSILKEQYDYIIIDSSPIGLVSDTFHLASKVDTCLLVVRSGKTLKDMFEKSVREISVSGIKSLSLVVNDIQIDKKNSVVYGDKYGYTDDKKKKGKRFFSKSKSHLS